VDPRWQLQPAHRDSLCFQPALWLVVRNGDESSMSPIVALTATSSAQSIFDTGDRNVVAFKATVLLTCTLQVPSSPLFSRNAEIRLQEVAMAPFHSPIGGTVGHNNIGRSLTRLPSHEPSPLGTSDEDPAPLNTGQTSNPQAECRALPHSSRGTTVSHSSLGHRDANEQPTPTTAPGQSYAGMAKPPPLESGPGMSRSPQHTSPNSDAETAHQDLTRLVDQPASLDTRASAYSSENGDSSPCSDGDDAHSYDTLLISDDESDAEDTHHYIMLGAWNYALRQPTFLFGMCDTGAAVSVLSYAKARLVAPDGIGDDVTHLKARTLDIPGGTVTVHGPIRVTFWLGDEGNRMRYNAPFYVLPRSCEAGRFDSLLNKKVVQTLGVVTIQRHPAAERGTRSASRGSDGQATVAGSSSAD